MSAVQRRRHELADFEARCGALDTSAAPLEVRVDHRLLMSALARVRWELDVLKSWRRDPGFYVDQSIGVAFDEMLCPPPFGPEQSAAVLRALAAVPRTLHDGTANLAGHADPLLTEAAAGRLADVDDQVRQAGDALAAVAGPTAGAIRETAGQAATALARYRDHLGDLVTANDTAGRPGIGHAGFQYFLSRVALLPYTPDELITIGRLEYERAHALEAIANTRDGPTRQPATSTADQHARQRADESQVRRFYADRKLLTLPPWLGHYRMAAIPPYLASLSWLGVTDDLTSPSRLAEDATTYAPSPADGLPFFHSANMIDNRLGVVHEGCHYYQLAQSWAHPDPARRHYYDSAPCEGIAFYNEEMLLEAGLFADNVAAHRLVRTFMRLRALRLRIDTELAIGALTYGDAQRLLIEQVPLDQATARSEAAFFAANPGQGISYQVGKSQVIRLLAAARATASNWSPHDFHDYLWRNGNVPLSLLRWELLGLHDDLDRADALAPRDDEVFGNGTPLPLPSGGSNDHETR
jgi:uncharacterized protein DUF885